MPHVRPRAELLLARLEQPRRFIQVLAGPRQVGKSTVVQHVVERLTVPVHHVSADAPEAQSSTWLRQVWEAGRALARLETRRGAVLVVDEVQKIPQWSDIVKASWDEDSRSRTKLKVVLLGSAPLLMEAGLGESLAGRFETIRMQQWPFSEMKSAFRVSLEAFVFFGGYPGAAPLTRDVGRWRSYIRDALIETTVARDILQMTRVDKPALLRRVFDLGVAYSGRELSFNKMLGQLQDAGNTVTLSAYGQLLSAAGLVTPLQKFAGQTVRQRASSPKWIVHDTALMTAPLGINLAAALRDSELWGRLVESAVGAHLIHAARDEGFELFYWRDGTDEVDFVAQRNGRVTGIEVKAGRRAVGRHPGMHAFNSAFAPDRMLLLGEGGISVGRFLSEAASSWLA